MSQLKIAVIADNGRAQLFARDALDRVQGCDEFTLFSCTNTRLPRSLLRHGAYYALNLVTLRNPVTRSVSLHEGRKRVARRVEFESAYEGVWQVLPDALVAELAAGGFDLVLKLGMGLLRVPGEERLAVPILSFHHGDPDLYRGRPAGFWEMLDGAPVMGQIVQRIGNRLDAGAVVAFAETKVHAHSYRATLIESYRHSPLLIDQAVRNTLAGKVLPKISQGRNCRLPSNGIVARFCLRMAARWAKRLAYGALVEKKWQVSLAECPDEQLPELVEGRILPPAAGWRTLPIARPYTFYADPFFSTDPEGVLVEALSRRTGRGEIVLIAGEEHSAVLGGAGHFSYPSTLALEGGQLVIPEIAQWSSPRAYRFAGGAIEEIAALDIEGNPAIADPTLVEHEGRLYLFGSPASAGSNTLFLWSADSLRGHFRLHPLAPIRISPRGARMAGGLLRLDGRLIRFGQDFQHGYGDGIFAFEIERLSAESYSERMIGEIRFADRSGPHTLNVRGGEIVFDWYRDRIAPLAGFRRLLGRLGRNSSRRGLAARSAL